jgi:hypothetical protein
VRLLCSTRLDAAKARAEYHRLRTISATFESRLDQGLASTLLLWDVGWPTHKY